MPHGHNIAKCLHCGKVELVGDFIPSCCSECHNKGHRGIPFPWEERDKGCPACTWEAERRRLERERIKLADDVRKVLEKALTAMQAVRKVGIPFPTRETLNAAIQTCEHMLGTIEVMKDRT